MNSGETYSLAQIFVNDTNWKVVIPDLQRDYCWGGKGTLVIDLVNNIKRRFEECLTNNGGWGDECLTDSTVNTGYGLMMGLPIFGDNRCAKKRAVASKLFFLGCLFAVLRITNMLLLLDLFALLEYWFNLSQGGMNGMFYLPL